MRDLKRVEFSGNVNIFNLFINTKSQHALSGFPQWLEILENGKVMEHEN